MREHFLLDPGITFLNHGSFGACPRVVLDRQVQLQRAMERNPVEWLGRRSATLLREARQVLGTYLHADADDIAFVPNATTGVNIAVQSIALAPGDEVLMTDHEYGACVAAWADACARHGARLRSVDIPLPFVRDDFVPRMMAAVTPRTRVIFCSHITSTTALIFPVAALCQAARARGITTVIDAAHAPGQIDVDLQAQDADWTTGNLHKWVCAPKGAAFLHVQPHAQAQVRSPIVSWGRLAEQAAPRDASAGHTGFDAYAGRTVLERRLQWLGTRDLSAWLAVPEALAFQQQYDWPAQRARCHTLAIEAMHRIAAAQGLPPVAPDDDFAQMVVIPVRPTDPNTLRQRLFDEHQIEIPITQHAGQTFVRLSVQAYNTEEDITRLEAALRKPKV